MQALLSVPEDLPATNGASQAASSLGKGLPAEQAGSAGAGGSGSAGLDAKTQDMLQQLSELSSSLMRDAKEDDEVFRSQHSASLD